jgi:hypothetical protein
MDILEIGLHDDLQIKDFFHMDLITDAVKSAPQFIHLDTSLKGDITGISDIAIVGKAKIHNDNGINELTTNRTERCYKHIFTVGIKAPQGDEISLEKTRQFIYYLKENGFNLKRISIDGFQSADTRQILDTNGYDAIILSMDKLKDGEQPGYSTARSAMNDGRVGMIPYERLENELVRLQKDNTTGKVDHPIDGSKDLSDSFAGAIYNASTYEESPTFNIDLLDSMELTNYDEDEIVKEQAILAKQLLMSNRKQKPLPEPIGLLDNINSNKNNSNENKVTVTADDFVIF